MAAEPNPPAAIIFGVAGKSLTPDEYRLFKNVRPAGFILFGRNIENAIQVRSLIGELRTVSNGARSLIMIDQEGGRVQRLIPPIWETYPPLKEFGDRALRDLEEASKCLELNYCLIAKELVALGINVNCAPVLDLFVELGNGVIGDRALSNNPQIISILGKSVCKGLVANGVIPVIKHIPGHGRAKLDSHVELPRVGTDLNTLKNTDFVPFRALRSSPAAMTAHILYAAVDPKNPASVSEKVILKTIREDIGFKGLLFSDDVCMGALSGSSSDRIQAVLSAGCDIALHCSGNYLDMLSVSKNCPVMSVESEKRMLSALAVTQNTTVLDLDAARRRIKQFLTS